MLKAVYNAVDSFLNPITVTSDGVIMNFPKSLEEKIAENERKPCKVKYCDRNRYRLSGYCCAHTKKNRHFGHPLHQRLTRNLYKYERGKCWEIIEKNLAADHPGIRYAVDFFDKWLEDAAAFKFGVVEPDHFKRLKDAGITGQNLLVECAAVWLLSENSDWRIYDHKHLIYCLGMKALRVSPYSAKTYGREHKAVGEHIINTIGVILVMIVRAVKEKEAFEKKNLADMYMPLSA